MIDDVVTKPIMTATLGLIFVAVGLTTLLHPRTGAVLMVAVGVFFLLMSSG